MVEVVFRHCFVASAPLNDERADCFVADTSRNDEKMIDEPQTCGKKFRTRVF